MVEAAEKLLTFEEFASLRRDRRYELVNGRLEELVAPRPAHSWVTFRFAVVMGPLTEAIDPGGYWGAELDVPTLPLHGRRPDLVYYASADLDRVDLHHNRVLGAPTLVVEILSPDDEIRDLVVKREEYARAGIAHYWILDPQRRTALTLVLRKGQYEVAGEFSGMDAFTSELFPGLAVPLTRLFPPSVDE